MNEPRYATDRELIDACLAHPKLYEEAREAFVDMLRRLEEGQKKLTEPQRCYVVAAADALGIDTFGTANLASHGGVKILPGERESLQRMYDSIGPKPLKPPGRK